MYLLCNRSPKPLIGGLDKIAPEYKENLAIKRNVPQSQIIHFRIFPPESIQIIIALYYITCIIRKHDIKLISNMASRYHVEATDEKLSQYIKRMIVK